MSMMERILRLMAEKKASDVYLSANAPALIKINGECMPINNQVLPPDAPRNPAGRDRHAARHGRAAGNRRAEHGRAALQGVGRFRVSAMRQRGSVAVGGSLHRPAGPQLESLKLPPILTELILEKRGLILVVGATGSGKSTTLAAMIDSRNEQQAGHILTIEDPIEFQFRNKKSIVNQREVGSDTQSLQMALKNALRQAPDVILIGEIRDRETMSAAIAYAQSGHLVLATLHGNNSYHALNRILASTRGGARHHAGRPGLVAQGHRLAAPAAHAGGQARAGRGSPAQHQAGVRADRKRRLFRRAGRHGEVHGRRLRKPSKKTWRASSPVETIDRARRLGQCRLAHQPDVAPAKRAATAAGRWPRKRRKPRGEHNDRPCHWRPVAEHRLDVSPVQTGGPLPPVAAYNLDFSHVPHPAPG